MDSILIHSRAYANFFAFPNCAEVARTDYPDGEYGLQIKGSVKGKHAIIVGGTINDEATLEIFDLANTAVGEGAEKLTLVVPYFGNSTAEEQKHPGEAVKAKTRAMLLSAIRSAPHGNHILCLDLHVNTLVSFFEKHVYAKQTHAMAVLVEALQRQITYDQSRPDTERTAAFFRENFVLGTTDHGRTKAVETCAARLGIAPAYVLKRRLSGAKTELVAISAQVEGKTVVVYDDMIRTGDSLVKAGQAYKAAGAKEIFALATHGVLPANSLEAIRATNLFKRVLTTNSHPNAVALHQAQGDKADGFLDIVPIQSELWSHVT